MENGCKLEAGAHDREILKTIKSILNKKKRNTLGKVYKTKKKRVKQYWGKNLQISKNKVRIYKKIKS